MRRALLVMLVIAGCRGAGPTGPVVRIGYGPGGAGAATALAARWERAGGRAVVTRADGGADVIVGEVAQRDGRAWVWGGDPVVVVARRGSGVGEGDLTSGRAEIALMPAWTESGRVARRALERAGLWTTVEMHAGLFDSAGAILERVRWDGGGPVLGVVFRSEYEADPAGLAVVAEFVEGSGRVIGVRTEAGRALAEAVGAAPFDAGAHASADDR